MASLHDQLLKAGLADSKKAQKARKEKHRQRVTGEKSEADLAREAAEQARLAKAERDRQLNREQQQQAEQKAIRAQIVQIVEFNRVKPVDDGDDYNFSYHGKVRSVPVDATLRRQLSRGVLAIVVLDDRFHLVPRRAAEKIAERDPSLIALLHDVQPETVDEDDPYADFQVPDDLMW